MFTTRPNSRDLWSDTDRPIRDILRETGMTMVQRRVQRLRDDDLAAQLWFIRASFATMPAGAGRSREVTHYPIAQNTVLDRERAQRKPDRAKPQELLAAARAVGDRLETLAVRGEDEHCAGALQADVEWAPHDSHGSLQ